MKLKNLDNIQPAKKQAPKKTDEKKNTNASKTLPKSKDIANNMPVKKNDAPKTVKPTASRTTDNAKKSVKNGGSNLSNTMTRTVTDFLNTDYRAYSDYAISSRCCPSIVDGMRTGARKILYSALTGELKNGDEKKLLNLIGTVFSKTLYAHGDASVTDTAVCMGSEYLDNLPALEIVGQHGFLRDMVCAAPRYLFCKLSKYSKSVYNIDEDLHEYVFDEGEYLEPVNFFPIIPTVLTSRAIGLAPGFKFQSFSYNPIDIIDACVEVIKGKDKFKTQIRPYVNGVKSENFSFDKESGRWYNVGKYTTDEKRDTVCITDLPYDVTFDKFEKKLNGLIDSEYIRDWKNFSHDDVIDYRIQFNKSKLARELQADRKDKMIKNFMLQSIVPEDLLYVLDEHKRVKHFQNKEELLVYFVHLRLLKYNDRKDKLVAVKEKQYQENSDLCRFIELVTSGKLKINNRKRSDIVSDLEKHKLPNSVLSVAISKLTLEEKDELLKKNKQIESELEYIKNTTVEQMYIDDLKELKKMLSKDFD